MVALPKPRELEIVERMYSAIKTEKQDAELYMGRLGSSFIGGKCLRHAWLSWRAYAAAEFDGRMYRLFETGHLQETRVIEDLRRAGFTVYSHDAGGEQFTYTDETGHFVVKLDGVIKGLPGDVETPHLLEIKTHNKNSFSSLQKYGVRRHKPEHFAQMQSGMWLGGFTVGLYVAVCKDDESYYVETVLAEPAEQQLVQAKVLKLFNATLKPVGVSADGSSFECKWCDQRAVCTGATPPLKTCRSCVNCRPVDGGKWTCEVSGEMLSRNRQRAACEAYEVL